MALLKYLGQYNRIAPIQTSNKHGGCMKGQTIPFELVAPAPTAANVSCPRCMRHYKISSNPHAEGIKFCPGCGEYVKAEYSFNNHNHAKDYSNKRSARLNQWPEVSPRDRKRLF